MSDEQKFRLRVSGTLFVLVLGGILIFGLWPFGSPRNDVRWVPVQRAVSFGERATILSSAPLSEQGSGACSIEMWLRPRLTESSGTILAFYGASGRKGLSMHQSESDLRLDFEDGGRRLRKYYTGGVFRSTKLVFLAVVSGPGGTQVYLDGSLARKFPATRAAKENCSGRFVVGDSPFENDSWQGEMSGLAIYESSVTGARVATDFRSWTTKGEPDASDGRMADALYLFDAWTGNRIVDRGKSRVDLVVPERYTIAQQILLETPWSAFEPTSGYVKDILINVGGFVPFGIALSVFLAACGRTGRVAMVTVLTGFLVSLVIETLQSRLPTRNSDLTDVATNSLGAAIGAMVYKRNYELVNGLIGLARSPIFA